MQRVPGFTPPPQLKRYTPPVEMISYPDNFELTAEKFTARGFESLSPAERIIHCIWWLEAEVNNGGFDQFFFNSAGDLYAETCDALTMIGANKTRKLLDAASTVAFPATPPTNRAERNSLQASSDEATDQLNDLDQKFYAYEDDLTQLVNTFLASHET